ncbi:Timeless protein [Parasponia andersonii]|uniref:Timeless protein n=1 Tax=Parasponia andersonii TaxID=3476 RepID=A0A2P5CB39_PARAD|nr:Timeless protein [Parasponia andersonii]
MDMEGLSVICAGLGLAEEDRNGNRIGYSKGEYCLDNLKDLMRFLRRDDPQNRDVFKQVCKWNTVSKDLIPIIEHCQDDRNFVLNAVKILVFLTMPIEPSSNDIAEQIEHLWGLKSSVTCSDVVAVIVSLLESPLENLERDAFTEDDWKLVQLILTLFRNLLAIQEISPQQKAGGTASHFISLRDRFLELLFRENVMDLIIIVTQQFGGYLRHDNLLLLEIFHYIFLGQEPELIAKAHLKGSKSDDDAKASLNSLKSIIEEEEEKRRLCRARNLVRHSHFIGTFTRLTMDGSKSVFNGKPASVSRDTLLKPQKVHRGPTKKIAWNHGRLPSSSKDKILELLHDFVNQFLTGGYNDLMHSVREDIEKEHHTIQKSDIIVFFQVAQFVTSFQYHKFLICKPKMGADASEVIVETHTDNTHFGGEICGPIAASMNESMFQLVFSNWRNKFESLKETHDFKFLSAAGSLMKNMICMLDLVLKVLPEDSKESQTARILLYKLFYDQTDQGLTQFLLNLLKSFDTHKQVKSDLEDLVEMIYKILELMENLQARGTLRVSRKIRKGRKKKALRDKETKAEVLGEDSAIQNDIGISNIEQPEEMGDAHKGIQSRSSDGKQEIITPAPTDKCEGSVLETDISGGSLPQTTDHKNSGCANEDLYGTGDSSSDEQAAATNEVDFQVSTLVSSFAHNNIIQKLGWLLKFYKSNSTSTNDYIISMLRRISDDLELSPMLYQLSILTTFYNILAEQKSCPCKQYANMVDFLTSLVRKMLKKMKNQPLLFVEVLFWKTRRECHYIDAEFLLHELGHLKKDSKNQENNIGDVDIGSSQAKGWKHISIADALGEDEADVVITHDLGNDDSEVNIGKVRGSTSSISDGEFDGQENNHNGQMSMESERVAKTKKRNVLGSDFDEKMRDLYEKFKDSRNCSRLIAEDLDPDGKISSFQVSKKLKELGLKCALRKRIRHTDEPNSFDPNKLDGEERVVETIDTLHNSNELEQSLFCQPMHARKRVRAFNEDEEANIRSLYERFKDHKRCSYMIASALNPDSNLTATQVSRKLKQLGLYIPQQRRSQKNMHLRHGDLNGSSTDKVNYSESDDETLLSLMKRSKNTENNRLLSEDAAVELINAGKLTEDDSDNEFLTSFLKKPRESLSKSKEVKLAAIPIKRAVSENGLGNGAEEGLEERDVNEDISMLKPVESVNGVASNIVSTDFTGEAKEHITGSKTPLHVVPADSLFDLPRHGVDSDDDLEDSDDEVVYSEFSRSVVNRRRMVLDVEDDD